MFSVTVSQIGNSSIVHCKGRLVHSDAAYALRDMVVAQMAKETIVVDLSEVDAIGGGGLGMLVFLKRWSEDNGIHLMMFNPSSAVRDRLRHMPQRACLELASEEEVLAQIREERQPISLAA